VILPDKHVPIGESLLGAGAVVLGRLRRPRTISALWGELREAPEMGTFHRYVVTLDFLHAIGAVELKGGLVTRCSAR
jgi:hypothetical protein